MAKKAPVLQTDELSYLPPRRHPPPPTHPQPTPTHSLASTLRFHSFCISPPVFPTATKIEAIANWKANVVGRASSIDPCSAYHRREAERRRKKKEERNRRRWGGYSAQLYTWKVRGTRARVPLGFISFVGLREDVSQKNGM